MLLSRALSVLGWSGRMSSHDSNGVDRPLLMNLYYSTGGIFSLDALQGALLSVYPHLVSALFLVPSISYDAS